MKGVSFSLDKEMVMHSVAQIYANPVFQALNPDGKRFLKAHALPVSLNPFVARRINMVALTLDGLPHLKAIAAVQMMLEDYATGKYADKNTIVIDSSGNTAHAVVRLAPAFGLDAKVVLAADVPGMKKAMLAALSPKEMIYVGKGGSVSGRAREEAARPGHIHLNQYSHSGNVHAHEQYTGREVWRALNCNVGTIAMPLGSGGTAAGVGRYLKSVYPDVKVIGVCPTLGQQVPGARDRKRIAEVVTLPWEEVVDVVVEVPRREAFIATRALWGAVEPQPGPTSGLAYRGLMHYLEALYDDGELRQLSGKNVAFLCPDSAWLYSDVMIAELDTDQGV
jgi:cysteine synthase